MFALAACGGGSLGPDGPSGVDPAIPVAQISSGDAQTFCEWSVDAQGGAGHVERCGGDLTVKTETVANCVASFLEATCDATVGEIEDCIFAIDGNGCRIFSEEQCSVLFECL